MAGREPEGGRLAEVSAPGLQRAAEALSQLAGTPIALPAVAVQPFGGGEAADDQLAGWPGAALAVEGVGRARVCVFASPGTLGRTLPPAATAEDAASAVRELANIVGCAYLGGMAEALRFTLIPTPPDLIRWADLPGLAREVAGDGRPVLIRGRFGDREGVEVVLCVVADPTFFDEPLRIAPEET